MTKIVKKIRQYIKLPISALSIVLYAIVVFLVYLGITKYVPVVFHQTRQLIDSITHFYQTNSFDNKELDYIQNIIKSSGVMQKIQSGVFVLIDYIYHFGELAVAVLLSFLLSFFFLIDNKKTLAFSTLFLKGDFTWFFEDVYYLGRKFVIAFGNIIETQLLIAIINTAITVAALMFMNFPQLLSLAIMIFLLSLIPVAGVLISCIPLTIIAYSVGGYKDVIYILLVVLFVHVLESYVLNPRLMANKTEIPMFFTFIILYLGESIFGVWGLIVGIPIATFLLDLLNIKEIPTKANKHKNPSKTLEDEG